MQSGKPTKESGELKIKPWRVMQKKSHCGYKSSGTVWNGYYMLSLIQQILFAGEERVEIV